jgi:hypothetical protein
MPGLSGARETADPPALGAGHTEFDSRASDCWAARHRCAGLPGVQPVNSSTLLRSTMPFKLRRQSTRLKPGRLPVRSGRKAREAGSVSGQAARLSIWKQGFDSPTRCSAHALAAHPHSLVVYPAGRGALNAESVVRIHAREQCPCSPTGRGTTSRTSTVRVRLRRGHNGRGNAFDPIRWRVGLSTGVQSCLANSSRGVRSSVGPRRSS